MTRHRWREAIVAYPPDDALRYRDSGLWGDQSIGAEFHAIARRHPERPALIGPEQCLTYSELDERTDQIAAALLDRGLRPGEAVLIQLDNTVETVLIWYGLLKATLVPVATLTAHRGHEIRQIGRITAAAAHVVPGSNEKFDFVAFAAEMAAESGRARLLITAGSAEHVGAVRIADLGADLDATVARSIVSHVQQDIDGDDVAVFQLSGGTTGTPKVIPRLNAEYWYNARAYAARMGWDESVRVTHVGPLVHNAGIVCSLHSAHSVGGAFVVGTPDPDVLLPLMIQARSTDILLLPSMVERLCAHPLFEAAFGQVRHTVLSGARVAPETFALFEAGTSRVVSLYGMGEGFCTLTSPLDPWSIRTGSVGYPLSPLDEVRIVHPDSEEAVIPGEVGELCCRGPYTIRGYLGSRERNAEAFTSDDFYRTGDLAREKVLDGISCIQIEGRCKDLVNRGGEKVNASEIEGIVEQMPGIRRAALVAVHDDRLGERGHLCVELEPATRVPELVDIARFLQEREVARYKWPESVQVIDSLPLTAVGKIDKQRIQIESSR